MKVCIVHASAGAGHQRAAEAIQLELTRAGVHTSVCIDSLDYTTPFFKKTYRNTYAFLVSKVPFVWKFAFSSLDISWLQPIILILRRCQNGFWARNLEKYFIQENFDVIISTHFMPNEVASHLKVKGKINAKIITCVTDYDVHRIWLAKGIDYYCVACNWTKEKVKWLGVNLEKVIPTGIPTMSEFSQSFDIAALKEKLGLTKDKFTVLMATGSFGFGPIEEVLAKLEESQVIVVCGHNRGLFERLSAHNYSHAKVLGHVDNMHELMAVSDVMITKPGGLSISEALVSQLPMIFFHPIPGQETNNIKVLNSFGIGTSDCAVPDIIRECDRLRSSSDTYLTALKKTKVLASPNAARDVVLLIP